MRDTMGNNVQLKTADSQEITIEARNIYQPQKNLGHFELPSGTYKTQTDAIFEKAVKINDTIAKFWATWNEAQMFYDLVWRPAIEYTLAQSFISDTQLQKIDKKLITLFACVDTIETTLMPFFMAQLN